MSLYEYFNFSEGVIEVAKIAFFWCRFFLGQGENTSGKKPAETQSMKIQVKSGEIPVRKNVGKIMKNEGSRRLTPKTAKLTC